MNAYQLANTTCANADGKGCAGLGISDDLQTFRMWPRKPRCTVDSCRCRYFETSVLARLPCMESGPERDNYLEALESYLRRLERAERVAAKVAVLGQAPDEVSEGLASSRKCACGKPLEARQRFCKYCAASRRREAARQNMASKRSSVNS